MINAAEPVDKGVMDAFVAAFSADHGLPRGVVFPTYGLAESTVMVTCNGRAVARVDGDELRTSRKVKEVAAGGEWLVGCGAPRVDEGASIASVYKHTDAGAAGSATATSVEEILHYQQAPATISQATGLPMPKVAGGDVNGVYGPSATGGQGC